MKKILGILILIIGFSGITYINNGKFLKGNEESNLTTLDTITSYELDLNGQGMAVGVTEIEAKELISNNLFENGVRGAIRENIIIKEITTKEIWENNNVEIYSIDLDYAWIHSIAIIKDNKVLNILNGMAINKVFISDIDLDEIYEIYVSNSKGSGMISQEILGYNISSNEEYTLADRGEKDFNLKIKDNKLFVDILKYGDSKNIIQSGNLSLRIIDNKKELYVES